MAPFALQALTLLATGMFVGVLVVALRLHRTNRWLRLEQAEASAAVRHIKQSLLQSEIQFRTIVENAPLMIDVFDEQGDLIRSGETSGDIEKNGSKQLKVAIATGFTSPDSEKSFRLELQVRDD